eukprot:1024829-Rhodomonas_salina.2
MRDFQIRTSGRGRTLSRRGHGEKDNVSAVGGSGGVRSASSQVGDGDARALALQGRGERENWVLARSEAWKLWLSRRLAAWQHFACNGGWGAPQAAIDDDDEEMFWDVDITPKERVEVLMGLRGFLLRGQLEWSKDGGVQLPDTHPEKDTLAILEYVKRAERLQQQAVIPFDSDAQEYLGVTWELSNFNGVDPELLAVLEQTLQLELEQLAHFDATGLHRGFKINAQGCHELGIKLSKILEWTEGVDFEVNPDLPHYSKGTYKIVYSTRDFILMAAAEFNKLLEWLLPVAAVPWIESQVMIVALEESGFKNQPVIDLTA